MSDKTETFNPFDPTGMLKTMRDSSMEAWSKMMIQMVNTEAYAHATATMLDAWLSTSGPFKKAIETAMTQVLSNLNMPTRGDIISLADRLTHIEMRLDDLAAKLEEGQHAAGGAAPRRTRKPSTPEDQP
jgi:hypothetical protein